MGANEDDVDFGSHLQENEKEMRVVEVSVV